MQLCIDDYIKSVGGCGVLNASDVPSLNQAEQRILALMLDGKWHSATEIVEVSGQREGLRRMRVLRRIYEIEKMRDVGREYYYRIVK